MGTGGLPGGPRGRGRAQGVGRAPTLVDGGWTPSGIFFAQYFLLIPKITSGVSGLLELCRIGL